jgi:hypothetical protein
MRLGAQFCNGRVDLRASVHLSGPQSDESEGGLPKSIAALFTAEPSLQVAAIIKVVDGHEYSVIYNRLSDDANRIELPEIKKHYLTKKEVLAWFVSAGFKDPETIHLLKNGYDPEREEPWFLVKTEYGYVEIGWRHRVISINWGDTNLEKVITADDVTKDPHGVHAWSVSKAIEYLASLKEAFDEYSSRQPAE